MAFAPIRLSKATQKKILTHPDPALQPIREALKKSPQLIARVVRALADSHIISLDELSAKAVFSVKSTRVRTPRKAILLQEGRVRITPELLHRLDLHPNFSEVSAATGIDTQILYNIIGSGQATLREEHFKALNDYFLAYDANTLLAPTRETELGSQADDGLSDVVREGTREVAESSSRVNPEPATAETEEWDDPGIGREALLAKLIGLVERNHALVERKIQLVEKTLELVDQVNLTLSENNAIVNRLADLLADSEGKTA